MYKITLFTSILLSTITVGFASTLGDKHILLTVPFESSPAHDYFGVRISGAGPLESLNNNTNLHLLAELGSYEVTDVDPFLRFKLGADLSYYHKFKSSDGFLSKLSPFLKGGIEWEYFDNTTQYTTGYDFSPLAYSDYYWEYYYETGTTFDFFNFNLSTGFEYELIEDKLSFAYNLMYMIPNESSVENQTTNKFELHYKQDNDTFLYVSHQMDDLLVYDNDIWSVGIGWFR